jgi:hypothetical protein
MSRYRAFAIHFGISLVILAVLAWLIARVWYPAFFFETDGGWEGIRLIVVVHLVLGPLLTLIVFRSGKPGLRFDLATITLVQAAALVGGTYVVHAERPLAMVYVDGHFFSLSRGDFEEKAVAIPDLDRFPGPAPKWVRVDLPDDPIAQSEVRETAWKAGMPLRLLTERYVPFAIDERFWKEAYDPAEIEARDWEHAIVPRWLADRGGELGDYRFYPFGARYKYVFVGYRNGTNDLMGLLEVPAPYIPEPDSRG